MRRNVWHLLPYYALRSVFRMFIALFLSLVFSFIYGLAAARCRRLRMVLIPLLDILQSVPILGFLSATVTIWMVLFPGSILGVEAASIFAIFTSQAWNMTFSFYHSLLSEPQELDEAARSMQLTRWQRFWKLDVPNSMIPLLWNCMMSVGGGWFFLTASEMISVNNRTYALPGLGSFVAVASEHEQLGKVLWAIVTMVIVVLLIDVLLWKPLTAWAEKFRITQNESVQDKTSLVLSILRRSGISDALVGVGAEVVALALDQGGGQARGAQAVEVLQRGGEHRHRDAECNRTGDHASPRALGGLDRVLEVRGEQQRHVGFAVLERVGDAVQELCTDDAATAPDARHRSQIDLPVIHLGGFGDLVEALGVRDDLRSVQRLADVIDERDLVFLGHRHHAGRSLEVLLLGFGAKLGLPGQSSREHGLGDTGHRHGQIKRRLHGPRAGALHARVIHDHVDQRLAGLLVDLMQQDRKSVV